MHREFDEDEEIIWLRSVVDKLAIKHHVETVEVEEVFADKSKIRCYYSGIVILSDRREKNPVFGQEERDSFLRLRSGQASLRSSDLS